MLAALLLTKSFRRLPAAVHHAFWCAALIGQASLFLSPAMGIQVPVPGLPGWASPAQHLDAPPPVRAPSTVWVGSSASAPPLPSTRPSAAAPPHAWAPGPVAWWAGAGIVLFMFGLGRTRRRAWRRRAAAGPRGITDLTQAAVSELGVRRHVRVLLGGGCGTPVTWGVFRPVVLLPSGAETWPRERLRAVLLHELAHVRRLDALTRGLAEALSVLLWFDPLVWLATRAMRDAAEAACDDGVVTAGVRPSRYVRHLVDVAREALAPPPAGSHAVARKRTLERRARAILDSAARRARPSPAAALVAGALTAVLALPVGALVPGGADLRPAREPVCTYTGGRHVDVIRATTWIVEWEGDGCSVAFRARGDVTFAGDLSGVANVASGGGLSIEVIQQSSTHRLRVTSTDREWEVDGERKRFGEQAEEWLAGFLIELERHTGFAVDARLPRLLDAGGPDLVIAEASLTRGGHAGGTYLQRLIEAETLDPARIARLLTVAATVVEVDAAMADLLDAVRARYDVEAPPLAESYATAAATLQARAAREEALPAHR